MSGAGSPRSGSLHHPSSRPVYNSRNVKELRWSESTDRLIRYWVPSMNYNEAVTPLWRCKELCRRCMRGCVNQDMRSIEGVSQATVGGGGIYVCMHSLIAFTWLGWWKSDATICIAVADHTYSWFQVLSDRRPERVTCVGRKHSRLQRMCANFTP